MSKVFISYRQDDSKAWALLLRDDLVEVFGAEAVFLDRDTLHAGSWRSQIEAALSGCSITLLVIGRHWLDARNDQGRRLDQPDDVHRREIAHALGLPGMTLIPVLVDDAPMPAAEALPEDIRGLTECQARRFSDVAAHREVDVRLLATDIARLGGLAPLPAPGAATAAAQVHYLPFALDEAQARAAFDRWAQGLLMAPRGFAEQARVQALAPCWVPHWRVQAQLSAVWQGRRGIRRPKPVPAAPAAGEAAGKAAGAVAGAAGDAPQRSSAQAPAGGGDTDWAPVQGELKALVDDLVLCAATLDPKAPELLTPKLVAQLQAAAALPGPALPVKPQQFSPAQAQSEAVSQLRTLMQGRARQQIGGDRQALDALDMRQDSLHLQAVLAPAYEGHYSYRGQTHALTISGHSGDVGASRPLDKGKLGLVLAGVALLVAALVVWLAWG